MAGNDGVVNVDELKKEFSDFLWEVSNNDCAPPNRPHFESLCSH